MRTALQVAKSWYEKSDTECDSFDEFIYLWFSFNALYGQYMDSSEKGAINDLMRDTRLSNSKYNAILGSQSAKYFVNRTIRDCRRKELDTRESVEKIKNISNTLKYRTTALIFIIYQVRCNLFHGNKDYMRDTDIEVIENATDVMRQVLKEILFI